MRKFFALVAILAMPLFTSCGLLPTDPWDPYDPGDTTSYDRNVLAGTNWTLTGIEINNEKHELQLEEGNSYTLNFRSGSRFDGQAACNSYTGSYSADQAMLRIDEIGSTDMFCGDEDKPLNEMYFQALASALAYEKTSAELAITSFSGITLHFARK